MNCRTRRDHAGLGWFSAIGPGVIVLGVSIGSGEFLLGPAAFVKYGLSLLWVVGVAALLQTLLNVELMRYTMATGEPIFTGFMRTRPHSTFWAWFYDTLLSPNGLARMGGAAAGAVFFLFAKRLPVAAKPERSMPSASGCSAVWISVADRAAHRAHARISQLDHGRTDHRWTRSARCSLRSFIDVGRCGLAGFSGFDVRTGSFQFVPAGADSSCSARLLPMRVAAVLPT